MITDYFRYINYAQSSFSGFYHIEYSGRSYYACAYSNRFRGKMELTGLLKSLKTFPKYNEGDFDFHHIVERPHLADISFSGSKVDESYPSMPVVMIHKGEHHGYNRILHAGETRELYMRTKTGLPSGVEDSENAVRKMAENNSEEARKEVNLRIDILKEIYNGVYQGNNILKIISANILNDYRNRLNRA